MKDSNARFAFEADSWESTIDECFELKEVHRQKGDAIFRRVLQELRIGALSAQSIALLRATESNDLSGYDIEPTRLHSTNRSVDYINVQRLKQLPGESTLFAARDQGSADHLKKLEHHASTVVELKIDAQVLLVKNIDAKSGLVNGVRGKVVSFDKGSTETLPRVKFLVTMQGGETYVERVIKREDFTVELGGKCLASRSQLPIKLAWALTIHKSQGMTINLLEADVQDCFDAGQCYVALSRATALSRLKIKGFNPTRCVKVSQRVLNWYESLRSRQPAAPGCASTAQGTQLSRAEQNRQAALRRLQERSKANEHGMVKKPKTS